MFKTIRSKFIIVYTLLIFIFMTGVIGTIYIQERHELLEISIESSLEMAKLYGENIGAEIDKNTSLLQKISKESQFSIGDMEHIVMELDSLKTFGGDSYKSVFYADNLGNVIDSYGSKSNIYDRQYFQLMKREDVNYVVSKPVVGKFTGVPIVVFAVPIRVDNEFVAAIGLSIGLDEFFQDIKDVKFSGDSYAWIVDGDGDVIIHPDESLWLNRNIHDNEKHGYNGFNKITQEILMNDSGYGYYYDENIREKKVVTFSSIPNSPNCKLAITTLEDDIFSWIYRVLRNIIITAIFFLLLFFFINYKLINNITRPINQLTDAVVHSQVLEFETGKIDEKDNEINHLINAYNRMNKTIEMHTKELEDLVEKRTEELNIANMRLLKYNRLLQRENKNLYDSASKDELTGLYNRVELFRILSDVHKKLRKNEVQKYTLLFLDLDNFKYYNDTFGHLVGDFLLRYVVELIDQYLDEDYIFSRYGGDEFVIVAKDVSESEVCELREKIILAIDNLENLEEKISQWAEVDQVLIPKEKRLGVSVGLYSCNRECTLNLEEVIERADQNMYKEKQKKKAKIYS